MSDLISRDKAVAAVLGTSIEYQLIYGKKEPKDGFVRSLIKSIANIPQEETERKRGKWMGTVCSECGASISFYYACDYCPCCGARMDAE